jgi:hypothetical protein
MARGRFRLREKEFIARHYPVVCALSKRMWGGEVSQNRHAGLVPASTGPQTWPPELLAQRSRHGGPRHKAGVTDGKR